MIISTAFSVRLAFHQGGKRREMETSYKQMREVWQTGEVNRRL